MMLFYKDSNNKVYAIESVEHIEYLPVGCIEVTQAEADTILLATYTTVPEAVTRFQALAALHNAGLLDGVKALMADPATDPITVLAWDNGQTFNRNSSTIISVGTALGLTSTDLDNLFIAAAQITVE